MCSLHQTSLRNITGVTSNKEVNADEADEVGRKIINDTFKQVVQITNIGSSLNCITINEEKIKIDPSVLFQRFVTCAESTDLQAEYLQFELPSSPPALLQQNSVFTDARKSEFCDHDNQPTSPHTPLETNLHSCIRPWKPTFSCIRPWKPTYIPAYAPGNQPFSVN